MVVLAAVAGWVTEKSAAGSILLAPITDIILTLCGVMNFLMIPHPLWFVIVGMLIFIPLTLAGYFVAKNKNSKPL
jgi:hypothetical protein